MRRTRTVLTLAVVVPLLIAGGCSDDDPEPRFAPTQSSSPSDTGSPSPAPTGPVEPTVPPAAQGRGPGAAAAFVEYFWHLVNYAQASGDVRELEELALDSCNACTGGSDWITKVYSRGGRIRGGAYSTTDTSSKRLYVPGHLVYQVDVRVSSTAQRVEGAGDLDDEYPAKSADFRFLLNRQEHRWLMGRWEVQS